MSKKKKTERESLEFYLGLKYPVTFYPDPDGGYVAEIKDLPGCMTQGETADEAMSNIEEARSLWIETAYEHGDEIPLPSTETQYSGRVLLRMPRSLHQQLVENAEREGVSLNQYILALLSERNATKATDSINEQLDRIYSYVCQQQTDILFRDRLNKYLLEFKNKQSDWQLSFHQLAAYLKAAKNWRRSYSVLPAEELLVLLSSSKELQPFLTEKMKQILESKTVLEEQVEDLISNIESDEEKVAQ